MRIVRVSLEVAPRALAGVADFYGGRLGLDVARADGSVAVRAGGTDVGFDAASADDEPFHHFAVRIPRNRFDAARRWLEERAGLLAERDTGRTTFRFASWNADACYAHDPAGNVVELIAHHELPDESARTGPFSARELIALCEVGVVGDDVPAMGRALIDAGVELWDGSLTDPDGIAFMGGRDGVLILSRTGRPWMPARRGATRSRVDAVVQGCRPAEIALPSARARVRVVTTGE